MLSTKLEYLWLYGPTNLSDKLQFVERRNPKGARRRDQAALTSSDVGLGHQLFEAAMGLSLRLCRLMCGSGYVLP